MRRYSQVKVHMHRYQRHRWQIFAPVSLALLIPAANLPPVSTTLVANNGNNYQTADNLKWTWKFFFICMLTLLPKGAQKKSYKFFWLKIFPFATGVVNIVANLELRIFRKFSNKIRNSPNDIIRGLGETDSWKKSEAKNLVTCPFHICPLLLLLIQLTFQPTGLPLIGILLQAFLAHTHGWP